MKARTAAGLLIMTVSTAALAQQMMPPGYADYVTDGIQWKFVNADGEARFGTVFADSPSEFAPIFITCSGGRGTIVFTLPKVVEPAQAGSVLRIAAKGRSVDVRTTQTDSMGATAVTGTFELAQMGIVAQGLADSDLVELTAGRWKMAYAARDFASAFVAFRQTCTGPIRPRR